MGNQGGSLLWKNMIYWEPIIERHVRGRCTRGELWIRLDGEGKVTALYTLFESTVKYLPETEEERGLGAMQLRAEIILAGHDFAEELAQKNKI